MVAEATRATLVGRLWVRAQVEQNAQLCVGAVDGDKLLLLPVDLVLQMRPDLSHLNVTKKGTSSSRAGAADRLTAPPTSTSHARAGALCGAGDAALSCAGEEGGGAGGEGGGDEEAEEADVNALRAVEVQVRCATIP